MFQSDRRPLFEATFAYEDVLVRVDLLLPEADGWRICEVKSTASVKPYHLGDLATQVWVAVGAGLTVAWGFFMHRTTDAALPWWDAFILVFSLIAQWLQARKNIENWPAWVVVNTVAIGVYWAKDLRLTSGLYLIFWVMALWGWRAWARTMQEAKTHG